MRDQEIKKLQMDVVIPDVVQRKAELALRQIQEESREQKRISEYRRVSNRKIWIVIAAAAAVMGIITACTAAYLQWSRGMEAQLHVTEEQKRYLEEIQIAAPAEKNNSVTSAGVTVTPVHLVLENLGTVDKAQFFPDLEGKWELDMKLSGSDQVRHAAIGKEIDDSGVVVSFAEISPVSLQITYEFEPQKVEIEAVGANGEPTTATDYKEPPVITGVRLKDGTLLMGIRGGGMTEWVDLEKGIYRETFAINRVLDTDQVDGLLFIKPDMDGENVLSEENLYVVPIESR